MNKIINFIESEWSRPAIVCFTIFLFFFFALFLSLADKREANRIEKQTESWIEQGYPIKKKVEIDNTLKKAETSTAHDFSKFSIKDKYGRTEFVLEEDWLQK